MNELEDDTAQNSHINIVISQPKYFRIESVVTRLQIRAETAIYIVNLVVTIWIS